MGQHKEDIGTKKRFKILCGGNREIPQRCMRMGEKMILSHLIQFHIFLFFHNLKVG